MIMIYLFLVLVAGVLIVAAILPSKYNIEKTALVKKPFDDVMNIVGDLNYYANWNPWQQLDPAATRVITGKPRSINHQYSWHGKKVGAGSLTIKSLGHSEIHFDLEFIKPWKSHAKDDWKFEKENENETKVTWHNSGDLPWPIARLMGPLINKNLNHQFEKALENLKNLAEQP